MKYGVVFPQPEIAHDTAAVIDFVQAAEDLGYDYLVTYDLVFRMAPDKDDFYDPLVLLSYFAGITSKIELSTGVLILPSRQATLVAKQAATLDLLSGGRLRLGVSVGWNEKEYQAMGADFKTRGRKIEEQVSLMRKLWTEQIIDFQGEFHNLEQVGLVKLPVQQPIPIWFGGFADRVLARVARIGDGWCADKASFEGSKMAVDKIRKHLEEENRSFDDFDMSFCATLVDPRKWPEETVTMDWGKFVEERRSLGASHVELSTTHFGSSENPQDHINQIRDFIEVVK
jgi:probable F420-dependent oxidoreductase